MQKKLLLHIGLSLFALGTYGQIDLKPLTTADTLLVSDIRTTHLLFDKAITYVDIGSPYFVADTVQHMIRLKHIGQDLTEGKSNLTNLTVITGDGDYYSLLLQYDRQAPMVSYKIGPSGEEVDSLDAQAVKAAEKESFHTDICNQIQGIEPRTLIRNKHNEDLILHITGIFYVKEKIGIRLEIHNPSSIDFDIDQILMRVKLKKRIAPDYLYQERVVQSEHTCTDSLEVIGNGYSTVILLFDKFMPNKKERLFIDIFEKSGSRYATLYIPRKKLLKPVILY